jgi:formylglycine-generating enzyme required for sulfatase activity
LTDPLGPPVAEDRVFRGGSFRDQADFLRSASREHEEPACQSRFVGLRVVRSIPPITD